jgi:hypothetical protein
VGVTSDPTLSDCIVDVGLTGDPSYAASAAAVEAATDAAPPKAAPKAVVLGQVVAGTIALPDEVDVYVFSAFAGQAVYLDAIGPCTTNISWRLMAPSGTIGPQIHVCKDLGRQELAETGTYTIEVFAPTGSRDVGPYAFAVRAASSATQTPLSFGTPVNGQVAQVGDQPRYQFSAPAGQIVLIDALGPCVEGLFWELLDPAGAPLTLEPVCVDIGRAQLAGAGTYTIEIYSDEAVTGPFSFTVYAVPQPRETGLVAGVQVSDQIATVGERHRYTFTASAGQVVTLDASGPCTDGLVWLLVGPLGDGLASADTCANLGPSTLTTTGTHTVEIYSLGTATGPYAFVLTVAN